MSRAGMAPPMITLGLVLLVIGAVFGIPILWTVGGVLLAVGIVLFLLGRAGHAIGGRNHWF